MFPDHKQELGESLLGMAVELPGDPPAPLSSPSDLGHPLSRSTFPAPTPQDES